jgi:S-layer protein
VVGSSSADTFSGVTSSLVAEDTFQAADSIDGGDGSDILNLDLKVSFSGFTSDGMSNVETVNLTNSEATTLDFSAKNITGVESYSIDSAKGINLSDLDSTGLGLTVKGTQEDTTISFASEVTDGTSDEMTIKVDGIGAAKDGVTAQVNPKITMAGIESVTLETTGSSSYIDLSAIDATTLSVTGGQSLTISAANDALETFSAAAASGDITADISDAGTIKSIASGFGADTITVDASKMQANATVNGGSGQDTLDLDGAGGTVQFLQSGFETIKITELSSGLTFSGQNTSDVAVIDMIKGTASVASFVNMGSSSLTINKTGNMAAGQDVEVDNSGAVVVNLDVTEKEAESKAAVANLGNVTLSKSSDVTVNVGEYVSYDDGEFITASSATKVTLNVDSAKDESTPVVEQTDFDGDLVASKATSITVNADGVLGDNSTINAAEATKVVLNTGETASKLELKSPKVSTLEVTSKGDFELVGSSELSMVQTLTVSTDGDFKAGALADINSITIVGQDEESAADLGDLGADDLEHNINITATGLEDKTGTKGLTLAAIKTTEDVTITSSAVKGAQAFAGAIVGSNVSFNTSGAAKNIVVTGTVDSDTTTAGNLVVNAVENVGGFDFQGAVGGATEFKNVTINANGMLGELKTLAVTATDTIAINAKGALKAITVGGALGANGTASKTVDIDVSNALKTVGLLAITADNITVDASSAIDTVTFGGALTVSETLDVKAGLKAIDLEANKIIVDNAIADAKLVASITGSILDDKATFEFSEDANAELVLSGDFGIGDDVLKISYGAVTADKTVKVDISGATNYDEAEIDISIAAATAVRTITLGADTDTIKIAADATGIDIIKGFAGGTDKLAGVDATTYHNLEALDTSGSDNASDAASDIVTTDAGADDNIAAAAAFTFTYDGKVYLATTADGDNYVEADDQLVEVTGYTGTIVAEDIIA